MSLTAASVTSQLTWTQNKTNSGFNDTIQGMDSLSSQASPAITGATPSNAVYAEQRTLAAAGTQTYNLQSMTDFLGNALVLTRAYAISISVSAGSLTLSQGATNPLTWPLSGTAPAMVIPTGGFFTMGQITAQAVSGSVKNLLVTAGGSGATYKIAILGGQ